MSNMTAVTKKRILLVVRWPVGGIRTFMRYVYRRFDPQKYHFTIVCPRISETGVLIRDLEGIDFKIIMVSEKPSFLELVLTVSRLLITEKYDLVHSHGFTSGICSTIPSLLTNTPHMITSHDMLFSAQFSGFGGWLKKTVMRSTLKLSAAIHLVSNDAFENLIEFFPELKSIKNKCVIIHNGIEVDRFINAAPKDLHKELDLGQDVFIIGFLGRFMSPKGFSYLVDAIELIKDSGELSKKPIILAFGEDGFIREEKVALKKRGLDDYFTFLPFAENVAEIIKGLDLVVIPSIWETCPILPMEVLVCGTPLIATDCIGLREITKDTIARQVPVKDASCLASAIRIEMSHPSKQEFILEAGNYVNRFDVEGRVEEIKKVYSNIMS